MLRALPVLLALLFLALHLPYLPASLEDVDSINFALGTRRFDVARHQPHPPGYPLFIAAGKVAKQVLPSEPQALAVVSVVSGGLGVLAIVALFRRLDGATDPTIWPVVGAAIVMTTPLYWFTAARPLSDTAGLAASLAVQALIIGAASTRALTTAAFLAGLAIGIRSQVLWLTAPLLIWKMLKRESPWHLGLGTWSVRPWSVLAFTAGALTWFLPLLMLSGGPRAYWRALFDQGAEDLSGIQMLWTTPTPRALVDAVYYAFVAPWGAWWLATAVLLAASIGAVVSRSRGRRAATLLAVAFGPYLVFDILFQETFTSRYALPLVVPVGFFATAAIRLLPQPIALVAAVPIVMYGAHIGGRSIAEYSRQAAPAFRLVADMREAALVAPAPPVLAPDRRESFDLRRPLTWAAQEHDGAPVFARQLPAPPQHEWLEAVKYWNAGGRAPVWFVVDPRRAAIDLVQHGLPVQYRWPVPYPVLMSGTRPNDADWYRVEHPDWYVGEGWSLTPESAGVAAVDSRGLATGPIEAWVSRTALANGGFVLGGRHFDASRPTRLTVAVGDTILEDRPITAGLFVISRRLPSEVPVSTDYLRLVVTADPPARIGVEQFDLSSSRGVIGFGEGWHEPELNPTTGARWRWMSDRAELRYLTPPQGGVLHISGESPLQYYAKPSRLVVRANGAVLHDVALGADFALDIALPPAAEPSTVVVETDQTYVPGDRGWRRTADRRTLGLRIYEVAIRPAGRPPG